MTFDLVSFIGGVLVGGCSALIWARQRLIQAARSDGPGE
jgi:hypothetical protein